MPRFSGIPVNIGDQPKNGPRFKGVPVGPQPEGDASRSFRDQASAITRQFDQPAVGMAEDVGRSTMSGLRSGVEGLAGQFGSANQMTGDVAAWLTGKMGGSEWLQSFARNVGRYASPTGFLPSTEEIQAGTNAAVGKNYQPKTTAGKYARTVAEFAPSAALGPGSAGRKVAMAVVPGLASEAAGQLTEGTAAEPWARAGAAIVGGALAAGRNPSTVKMAAEDAPTAQALKAETDSAYQALRDAGIRYDADSYSNTVLKMAQDLRKEGFRPVGRVKEAFDWVDELAKDVGNSPDFSDINSLRSAVGEAARDAYRSQDGKSLGKALDIIKDHLDTFESSTPFISDTPMPQAQFDELRTSARQLALRSIKQRALDEIVANADTYQSGRDAGIRNGIGNLLRSKRGIQLFSADERKALLDVQLNNKALRSLSRFGVDFEKLSGNATLMPTIGAGSASAVATGLGIPVPLVAGGLVGAGTAAKFAAPRITEGGLNQVGAAIRSGNLSSPEIAASAKALRNQKFIRQLLTGVAGIQSARGRIAN